MRFARALLAGLALLTPIAPVGRADAEEFAIVALKVSLPVNVVVGSQIVQRTLKEKDLVNLALGRPLGTKVDKKTEVLAVAFNADDAVGSAIVCNPSQNGLAQITTTVAEPTSKDLEKAYISQGVSKAYGALTGTIVATTLGNPAQNGLLESTLFGGGGGSAAASASGTGVIAGRLHFRVTENGQTRDLAGFIVKGKAKVSGKPLGFYDDGSFVGCGDGIIQPELGEECEFGNDALCPGHCDACVCVVCGNARIDPGEICDGATLGVCADLETTCRTDCEGCQF